jgi:hypothetical protein
MSSTIVEITSLKEIAEIAGFNIPEYSEVDKRAGADFLNIALGSEKQTYIRFAALLEFLEKTQQIYTNQGNPLIKFDYRIGYSYMITNKWIISSDPNKCLINPGSITLIDELKGLGDIAETNQKLFQFFQTIFTPVSSYLFSIFGSELTSTFKVLDEKIPKFKNPDFKNEVGDIMNIFLEVDFVFSTLLENIDNKTGVCPIYKFLEVICNSINASLGNLSSIAPIIDEKTNLLCIIEEGGLPNVDKILDKLGLNKDNTPLNLFGYSNFNSPSQQSGFVKSFSLKTEITNDLATMVTIGAQANGKIIKGMDATAFSSWNRGLVDRIIPEKKEISVKEQVSQSTTAKTLTPQQELLEKYKNGLSNYVNMLNAYHQGDFNEDEIPSYTSGLKSLIQYEKELIILEKETKDNGKILGVTQQGFLPINLNLTLDGISGPVIYQQFEVDGNFLPHPISDTLTFLTKGISHKISNNTWTTTIDSLSVPKFIKSEVTNKTPTQSPPQPSPTSTGPTPNADRLRETLKVLGYQEKGNEISNGGDITIETANMGIAVFTQIKTNYPNLKLIVTGGNDKYHQLKASPNGRHRKGLGLDFVILPKSSTNVKNIEKILQGFAAGSNRKFRFLNEYKLQTVNATGEHFHMSWGEGIEGLKSLEESIKLANNNQIETYTI